MVVGTLSTGRGLYQAHELRVEPPERGWKPRCGRRCSSSRKVSTRPRQQTLTEIPRQRKTKDERPLAAGSFFVDDKGYIMQVVDKEGGCEPVLHGQKRLHALSGTYGQRLAGLN